MKIKLTETQIQKVLTEIGGYDSPDLMGMHGGLLQGEISMRVTQVVLMVQEMINALSEEELSKHQLMAGVHNLTMEIENHKDRLSELTKEIFIDEDFKSLMIAFLSTLNKITKYFKMLVSTRPGMLGGKQIAGVTGLALDMGASELGLEIAKKLSMLGEHHENLGKMFASISDRYNRRLEGEDN